MRLTFTAFTVSRKLFCPKNSGKDRSVTVFAPYFCLTDRNSAVACRRCSFAYISESAALYISLIS